MLNQNKLVATAALALVLSGCNLATNGLDYSNQAIIRRPPPPAPAPAPLPPPPPAPACEMPTAGQPVTLDGCKTGDTLILRGVSFETGKSSLTVNAKALLDFVADALKTKSAFKVEVDGHTDSVGGDAYNMKLSEHRAVSVKKYLVAKGIDASRLTTKGFGETMPIADNGTPDGREINRRVELKVLEGGS